MTQKEALSILKTGANVFLTGEPGSGKTHTINEYVKYLRAKGMEPAITASTGIAATHIGGMTIHSWSGIGIKTHLDEYELDRISSTKYIVKRVMSARVLIIDEVSMLPPNALTMIDAVCREIKQSSAPFGGLQIVLVGDFFQLPPIVKGDRESAGGRSEQTIFVDDSEPRFAYDSEAWKRSKLVVCYLTEQHRQDDSKYLALLSAIRANTFSPEHLSHIKTRIITGDRAPTGTPKLFAHNADVNRVNDEILSKLPGAPQVFAMSSSGHEMLVGALKRGCLSPEKLYLKVGTAVMFTKNNPKEGYVNGSLGMVEKISDCPVVKLRNGRMVEVRALTWAVEEGGRILARITQVPLRLAWAITVHKSQGMSLDEAVMDLRDVFEYGQGYVALSRVRRLSGLYLLGWNERAFQVHPGVLAEDMELRRASEEANAVFGKMKASELKTMHTNFIRAAGIQ
ncbi:MAG: PIF1 family DEAD/DEAH box helicase [bacterium]|nr:PIF1 family DEAD/DEAH box helicase [bacterium]